MKGKGNISTRAGDKGKTSDFSGQRVSKSYIRIQCLGDLDEANSFLGLLRTKLPAQHPWEGGLREVSTELMNLMAHVATPSTAAKQPSVPLPEAGVKQLEQWMADIEASLSSATVNFLLPGGTEIAALCHVVRTVVRRAERELVALNEEDPVNPAVMQYINRLSDLMFKLARQEIDTQGAAEERWQLFRKNE